MAEDVKLAEMTTDIISAFVANNAVPVADLPALIQSVHSALDTLGKPVGEPVSELSKATAAQIRKSITPDALISFEDGKSYKTLKRHLSKRGMTVDEYKAKWGLPKDYPTTAPSYSAKRSEMALKLGLGSAGRRTPKTDAPKAPRAKKVAAAAE